MKKIITENKRASFNYEIVEKFEAGIKLTGAEVKSVKYGYISLQGSYVTLDYDKNKNPKLTLRNCRISKYKKSGYSQSKYDPLRPRQLLLNKREVIGLLGKLNNKGLTMIPLSVYTKQRLIKLEIALVKGKTKIDKRESIKKREINRRIRQKMKI